MASPLILIVRLNPSMPVRFHEGRTTGLGT